jgi:hypothetical protein
MPLSNKGRQLEMSVKKASRFKEERPFAGVRGI